MERRSILAALGGLSAGLSGCFGSTPSESATDSDDQRIDVTANEPLEEIDIGFTVSIEDTATADQPAKLRIVMRNHAGDGRTNLSQTVETGPKPPFSGRIGETDGGDRLVLEPISLEGAETSADHADGDCWRATPDLLERLLAETEGDGQTVSLDADGGVYLTYYLLAHPDADGCMPAGTYRFESDRYGEADHTWGFELTLTEPITSTE